MEGSKAQLIQWANSLLQLNYSRIEDFGTGAAYCQIMHAIYPDVPMQKVNFHAKLEHEFVPNYKVLQTVFDLHKVDKQIPVERLMKCKPLDNLEFVQWLKKFFDAHYAGGVYDATSHRKEKSVARAASNASTFQISSRPILPSEVTRASNPVVAQRSTPARQAPVVPVPSAPNTNVVVPRQDKKEVEQLSHRITELKLTADGLEKERDFYFGKLRDIEVLCQKNESDTAIEKFCRAVQSILYSTEEGFDLPENIVQGQSTPRHVQTTPSRKNERLSAMKI